MVVGAGPSTLPFSHKNVFGSLLTQGWLRRGRSSGYTGRKCWPFKWRLLNFTTNSFPDRRRVERWSWDVTFGSSGGEAQTCMSTLQGLPENVIPAGRENQSAGSDAQPPTEKVFPSSSSFISPSKSWWCIISNLNFNYCCIIRRNLTTTCTFMFSHFSVIIIPITFKSCKWVQSAVHTSDNGTAMAKGDPQILLKFIAFLLALRVCV